jgi:hypothetical protein
MSYVEIKASFFSFVLFYLLWCFFDVLVIHISIPSGDRRSIGLNQSNNQGGETLGLMV